MNAFTTKTAAQLQAEINQTPVQDQARVRALYVQLFQLYAEQLRPTR